MSTRTLEIPPVQTAAVTDPVDGYPVNLALSSGQQLRCDVYTALSITEALHTAVAAQLPGTERDPA